jgi:hypothetical protein
MFRMVRRRAEPLFSDRHLGLARMGRLCGAAGGVDARV